MRRSYCKDCDMLCVLGTLWMCLNFDQAVEKVEECDMMSERWRDMDRLRCRCQVCGAPAKMSFSKTRQIWYSRGYCDECYLVAQQNYYWAKRNWYNNHRLRQSWMGDRRAEIRAIEYREKERLIRKYGGSVHINAGKADRILAKYYRPAELKS